MPVETCSYCAVMPRDDMPRPYGRDGMDGEPQTIFKRELYDGEAWLCCKPCYRRGGRWRAEIRTAKANGTLLMQAGVIDLSETDELIDSLLMKPVETLRSMRGPDGKYSVFLPVDANAAQRFLNVFNRAVELEKAATEATKPGRADMGA